MGTLDRKKNLVSEVSNFWLGFNTTKNSARSPFTIMIQCFGQAINTSGTEQCFYTTGWKTEESFHPKKFF